MQTTIRNNTKISTRSPNNYEKTTKEKNKKIAEDDESRIKTYKIIGIDEIYKNFEKLE